MQLLNPESLKVSDEKSGRSRYMRVTPLGDGYAYQVSSDGLGVFFTFFTEMTEKDDDMGRILFDRSGNWIYDGSALSVTEQEDLAHQILHYSEIGITETKLSISHLYERHL